jgi:ribosomal protein S18 acetylase RimI-like enzyme
MSPPAGGRHAMVSASLVIRQAVTAADMETARSLFLEYAAWLQIDLCFQGFSAELAGLPGGYAPPDGRLLLAEDGGAAGCVALRRLGAASSGTACELKRLWVRPAFRGRHAGRTLATAALAAARAIGYRHIKLDTLPAIMPAAVALYRDLGFTECAPYYLNPIPGSLYMERAL